MTKKQCSQEAERQSSDCKSREVVAEDPAANTREVGVAETPKSTTFIEMTALCETEPLVPVTVIV
jgi:hypothetical protein